MTLAQWDAEHAAFMALRDEVAARPHTDYNVRVLELAELELAWVAEQRRLARAAAIRASLQG